MTTMAAKKSHLPLASEDVAVLFRKFEALEAQLEELCARVNALSEVAIGLIGIVRNPNPSLVRVGSTDWLVAEAESMLSAIRPFGIHDRANK